MSINTDNLQEFSPREMYRLVNLAIANVLVGNQSAQIGTRSYTKADLGKLKELRDQLAEEIAQGECGGAGFGNVLVKLGFCP